MVRHASDNLTKAIAMARNGHEEGFRAAWLICNELEGGATTWGNAQRMGVVQRPQLGSGVL